ncbi:MAG: hypothetical protein ALECFALPRED_001989 [Alectoria fallacina]|uniref:Uncharacterized protein n=1 Tax=Alectoria fallacina TaxID=1903189 RepID=A0A8H3F9N6_9LECA|nr:MAG: hypothetical protein ALECFALPRED_001989 [Alectoria fallacina]
MSELKEKELQLVAAMVKNFNGSIYAFVDWNQAALDAGFEDAKNAKTMWSRLAKKFADANAAAAANGNDNNAGEGSTTTLTATPSKKRKAAGTSLVDDSPTNVAQNGRPTKKAKGSGGWVDQLNPENEAAAAKVKT